MGDSNKSWSGLVRSFFRSDTGKWVRHGILTLIVMWAAWSANQKLDNIAVIKCNSCIDTFEESDRFQKAVGEVDAVSSLKDKVSRVDDKVSSVKSETDENSEEISELRATQKENAKAISVLITVYSTESEKELNDSGEFSSDAAKFTIEAMDLEEFKYDERHTIRSFVDQNGGS